MTKETAIVTIIIALLALLIIWPLGLIFALNLMGFVVPYTWSTYFGSLLLGMLLKGNASIKAK